MFPESKLRAAVYRFEADCGRQLEASEMQEVVDAGLADLEPNAVADQICRSIETGAEPSSGYRGTAFWALGKRYDRGLLTFFRRHLAREVERDMKVAYQVMIALDNLDEAVWADGQVSFGVGEVEKNRAAAIRYLETCSS